MRGDGDNQLPCSVAEPVSEKESHLELYLIPTRKIKSFTASERVTVIAALSGSTLVGTPTGRN